MCEESAFKRSVVSLRVGARGSNPAHLPIPAAPIAEPRLDAEFGERPRIGCLESQNVNSVYIRI